MKNQLLKTVLLSAVLCSATAIHAHDFEAVNENGVTIYYNILSATEKTCEVTFKGTSYQEFEDEYSGAVKIPETANYSSVSYKVTSIGNSAFEHCGGLTSVEMPHSVLTLGYNVFSGCSNLSSVEMSNSITSIGGGAFTDCSKLSSVTLPNTLTSIGAASFSGSGLTSFTIPASVQSIGVNPISDCANLTSIVVEENNPYFHSQNHCNAIIEKSSNTLISGCKNTVIPNTVTTIGINAFRCCHGLTAITIPNSVTTLLDGAFYNCEDLTAIEIPNSIKTMEMWVFGYCFSLASVKMSNAVTSLRQSVFFRCTSLTSIEIPKSVTSIEALALEGCSSLKSITSYITDVFKTGQMAFRGCENAILYVPKGLVETYKTTKDWNTFNKIVENFEKTPMTLSCNSKGSIDVNGIFEFSNSVAQVDVKKNEDNTFKFTPEEGCRLEQVSLNGFDISAMVKNNTLTTTIPENSTMIVTFARESADINGDGYVDISDVVRLVNIILGQ